MNIKQISLFTWVAITTVLVIQAGAQNMPRRPGTVVSWGNPEHTVAVGLTEVVAIGAGAYKSLALESDGTVLSWGVYGGSLPAGLTGILAIATSPGDYHSLALKSNGTLVAWGDNISGQSTVPVGLTNVVAIAAGGGDAGDLGYDYQSGHNLVLKSDGTVVAWGYNSFGQSTVPAGLNGVVAISAGSFCSLALKSNGTVVAWGGQFSEGTVPAGLNGVIGISAGYAHCLALKSDGSVVAWGENAQGQGTVPLGLTGVVAIAAGGWHNLALKSDGTVVAWGSTVPVPTGLTGVVAIAAGWGYSLALVAATNSTPSIMIQSSGNTHLLSWPLTAQGFALQSTTNLPDANSWITLTNLTAVAGSQYRVTDTISGASKFYRLKK